MALTDGILAYWNLNDNGSGGVSLVDSTGNNNTLTNDNNVTLGTGIIAGGAVFNTTDSLYNDSVFTGGTGDFSFSIWVNPDGNQNLTPAILSTRNSASPDSAFWGFGYDNITFNEVFVFAGSFVVTAPYNVPSNTWTYLTWVRSSGISCLYINGVLQNSATDTNNYFAQRLFIGNNSDTNQSFSGTLDEIGFWQRALSTEEVNALYNGGAGLTYPFITPATQPLYYNNAQSDGDWGNLLNWWQDSGFTIQATALPTSTNPINLYGAVTQNTQGANQCFCSTASFWSADFGAGLTLQASDTVNMQGSSILAGTTTAGVSMHDSSQIASTGVVNGNVVLRDASRNHGTITGNATVYYDSGNGLLPITGTVNGYTSYLEWGYIAPCPASGGHSAVISRLLHLPWFINI